MGMLAYSIQLHSKQKQPNLKKKTWPNQLLGYLPIAIALPSQQNTIKQHCAIKEHHILISSNNSTQRAALKR